MKYLSLNTVFDAFCKNSKCTKSKFWGVLAILQSIQLGIKPGVSYPFKTYKTAKFLENLFCFKNKKDSYADKQEWYIMFSKFWISKISEQMCIGTPNIYDVAVWFLRNEQFNDEANQKDCIIRFLRMTGLSLEQANDLFNFDERQILFENYKYDENSLLKKLSDKFGNSRQYGNITSEGSFIVSNPGEFSRAPFIQTLYAAQQTTECLFLTQFSISEYYNSEKEMQTISNEPLQQIYYGAPGTGKSYKINKLTNKNNSIRTTFHPDSDYSTFVGCYKPTKDEESGEITYDFTPQAFTNAYVAAWKNVQTPFFLIIEEINRGNCAQIFGDIFQLLDRNEQGYSSYKTTPDQDLANYIRKQLADTDIEDAEVKSGKKMQLPPNLHIWATMNTSDQSLFPIDSAFKRRWDWRYIPIDYTDRGHFIACGDTQYSWADFLQKVNDKVEAVTQSEDKKLGYWFMGNGAEQKEITIDRFVSKVIFYLWNDVFKDFGKSGNTIFKDSFAKFHLFFDFSGKPKVDVVKAFLDALEVKSGEIEAGNPENGASSNGIDYTKYTFDGQNKLSKKTLGEKIVMKYLELNPNLSFDQIKNVFAFDDSVVSKEQYKGIIAKSEDITGSYVPCYGTEQTSSDGIKFKVLTWWNKYNINFIIKFAKAQGWSVTEVSK